MHITCTYSLGLLSKRELKSFSLVLPLIARGYTQSDSAQLPDIFLHCLVVGLLEYPVAIRELTMTAILKEFWLVCALSSESALLHLCHLLWGLHSKINPTLLEEMLDEVKPGEGVRTKEGLLGPHPKLHLESFMYLFIFLFPQQSEVAHQQYRTLMEHIENS